MKRKILLLVALVVLSASAYAVFRGLRARENTAVMVAAVPVRPALDGWPAEFRRRIEVSEEICLDGPDRQSGLEALAQLYHANGFFPEAEQCYRGLIQVDGGNARWPHRLASVLANFGQLEGAVELWEAAKRLDGAYLPLRIQLGNARLKLNRGTEAAEEFQAVLLKDPGNVHALVGLARVDAQAGRYGEARQRLEKVNPGNNEQFGADVLVLVYEKLGLTAEADAIRGQSKTSRPYVDTPDPWVDGIYEDCYEPFRLILAAGAAERNSRQSDAWKLLQRAERYAPDNVAVQYHLGIHAGRYLDTPTALRHLERCVALQRDFADGWLRLFILHRARGDQARMAQALAAGLANCPRSAALHLEHGRYLASQNKPEEALAAFSESVRLRPEEGEGYVEMALVYFSTDRIAQGLERMEAALKAEPQHPMALSTLAMHQVRNGSEADALRWLQALRQQPRIKQTEREHLARLFRERFGRDPQID